MITYDINETLMKLSDYNKLASYYNLQKINLKPNEYAIIANYENIEKLRNESLKLGTKIILSGKEYKPKYTKCINGFLHMTSTKTNTGFIVLNDEAINEELKEISILIANYKKESKEEKKI